MGQRRRRPPGGVGWGSNSDQDKHTGGAGVVRGARLGPKGQHGHKGAGGEHGDWVLEGEKVVAVARHGGGWREGEGG